jgi:hypothetical protein
MGEPAGKSLGVEGGYPPLFDVENSVSGYVFGGRSLHTTKIHPRTHRGIPRRRRGGEIFFDKNNLFLGRSLGVGGNESGKG